MSQKVYYLTTVDKPLTEIACTLASDALEALVAFQLNGEIVEQGDSTATHYIWAGPPVRGSNRFDVTTARSIDERNALKDE